jgi:hypothetical protein
MYCHGIFLEEMRKTTKTTIRIVGIWTETQKENILNTRKRSEAWASLWKLFSNSAIYNSSRKAVAI